MENTVQQFHFVSLSFVILSFPWSKFRAAKNSDIQEANILLV